MVSLMQNEGKTDNRKTMITFTSNDLALYARVEYANIDCEINQSEHSSSLMPGTHGASCLEVSDTRTTSNICSPKWTLCL